VAPEIEIDSSIYSNCIRDSGSRDRDKQQHLLKESSSVEGSLSKAFC
jgi:hypothetical protein